MFLLEIPIEYEVEFNRPKTHAMRSIWKGRGTIVSGCFSQQTYCKVQETGPRSQNENDRQRICKSCIRLKVQDPRNPIPVSASPTRMKSMHGVHTYRRNLDMVQRSQIIDYQIIPFPKVCFIPLSRVMAG